MQSPQFSCPWRLMMKWLLHRTLCQHVRVLVQPHLRGRQMICWLPWGASQNLLTSPTKSRWDLWLDFFTYCKASVWLVIRVLALWSEWGRTLVSQSEVLIIVHYASALCSPKLMTFRLLVAQKAPPRNRPHAGNLKCSSQCLQSIYHHQIKIFLQH